MTTPRHATPSLGTPTSAITQPKTMDDHKDTSSTSALPLAEVSRPDSPELSRMQSFQIEEGQGRLASDLPPVDGGRKAWSYLIAATAMETLIWGEHIWISSAILEGADELLLR